MTDRSNSSQLVVIVTGFNIESDNSDQQKSSESIPIIRTATRSGSRIRNQRHIRPDVFMGRQIDVDAGVEGCRLNWVSKHAIRDPQNGIFLSIIVSFFFERFDFG